MAGRCDCLRTLAGIGYYRLIRSLKGTSQPVERADLHTILQEQCADLVIDREIPLRVSSAADCPMLAGFIHPTLYLPDERISRTDAAFIFRHELTHYKHGDLWLKLLLLAARCLHWFNPLVHLIARFAQEDIEAACDDAVVRGHDGAYRRAYGETILRSAIAQSQRERLWYPASVMTKRRSCAGLRGCSTSRSKTRCRARCDDRAAGRFA